MSRLAQWKKQQKEEQQQSGAVDKRNLASKLWDTVNIADSGRSWTTDTPSEEGAQESGYTQIKKLPKQFFSATEKLGDSVDALSGHAEREAEEMRQKYNRKEITKKEYDKYLKDRLEDTVWAGTEDKGTLDRLKKSAGVSAGVVSEWLPVGAGAKGARAASEVVKGSKLALFKAAANQAAKDSVMGAVGSTAEVMADDSVDLGTAEGRGKLGEAGLTGMLMGGVMSGAGALTGSAFSKIGGKAAGKVDDVIDTPPAKTAPVVDEVVDSVPDDLDVPAFMRRTSADRTKDEMNRFKKVDNPSKDKYKKSQSDARGANNPRAQVAKIGEDPADIGNIPAFQRKGADAKISQLSNDIDNIDAQLASLPDGVNIQEFKFKAKQQLAEMIKKNPEKKKELTEYYNRRMNPSENAGSLNELRDNLAKKRQELQDELQYTLSVKDAVEIPKTAPVDATMAERANQALTGIDEPPSISAPVERVPQNRVAQASAALTGSDEVASISMPVTRTSKEIPDKYLKEYADIMKSMDDGATGGQMIPDGEGGYKRTSEHSPFYREFFAANGRKPGKKDWLEYAKKEAPKDKDFMDYVDAEVGQTPDVAPTAVEAPVKQEVAQQAAPQVGKTVAPVEKPIPKPPTVETLEAPDGFRALDDVDINEVTNGRPVDQTTSTIAEQKAKFIGSDLNRLAEETGVGLARVDEDIAEDISKRLQGTTDQATTKNSIVKSIANQFQDTITVAAKTVGKEGVDFVHNLLGGEKFKRESLNILRDDLAEIQKLGSKLTGKTSKFKKPSRTARVELGAKLGAALDDRANAANYLKTPDEMKLFEHYVKVFDFVKARREEFGMEVVENYRPWVNLRDASEDPTWLVKGLTDSKIETLSRFSKERVRDEAGDNVDENLLDMIYGYVNSQLNEMAYDAPVRKFKKDVANSTMNPNSPQYREGMDYLSEVLQQAVSPKAKNKVEKVILGAGNRVYSSVLPFNPKLTMQNMTQRWAANSRVSKGAVSLSKKMKGAEFKELEHGLVFGDQTVFGQLEDISAKPTGTNKGFKDKAKNLDYYQKSETRNVTTSFRKGAAQAIIESEPYKAARKQGMNSTDAMKAALQDETVKKNAIQRGNMVVNDTQFGASHIARPAALRSEGSVLGVPIKALTMFTRFPIGMSQHVLEMVDGKSARALDVLKNGDPRSVPIAEMRSSYGTLLEALKDSKKAVDDGVDIGISKEALDGQISLIDKNLKVIDKELKKHSSVRTGKTAKNLVKMWTAAAAIQVLFDGGIQSFAEDPLDPVAKTNPTATGMVFGKNSKLGGFTSAAIPVNKYGLNERALTNYIPGVGLAVNRARDVNKLYNALTGEQEE